MILIKIGIFLLGLGTLIVFSGLSLVIAFNKYSDRAAFIMAFGIIVLGLSVMCFCIDGILKIK